MIQDTVDKNEAARRRQSVHDVLRNTLGEEKGSQAIQIWDKEFSQSPAFSVVSYMVRLGEVFDIAQQKNEIAIGLMRSQLPAVAKPSPDSFSRVNGHKTAPTQKPVVPSQGAIPRGTQGPATAVQDTLTDELVVFNFLLSKIMGRLVNEHAVDLKQLRWGLSQELSSAGLGAWTTKVFQRWLDTFESSTPTQIDGEVSTDEMAKILHLIYIWSCEVVGPVATDQLYSAAARASEALPQAARFSARQLF